VIKQGAGCGESGCMKLNELSAANSKSYAVGYLESWVFKLIIQFRLKHFYFIKESRRQKVFAKR